MPEYLAPGVYVESTSAPRSITGVDTDSALMVGVTVRGPDEPVPITSFADFTETFGDVLAEPAPALRDRWALDLDDGGHWWHFALSVKGFFENGGRRAVIKRVSGDAPENLTPEDFVKAIQSLNEVTDVGLSLVPGMWSGKVQTEVIQRCEAQGDCFAILDPPNGLDITGVRRFCASRSSSFAALYYPWLEVADINGRAITIATSGHVAGIYARVDQSRGVHAAPANEAIAGITQLSRNVTKTEQELLNPEGINALRFFPGRGNLVWGGRTLSPDPEWKYVNVRRLFIYLERSIDKGTQWAVFEANDESLWASVQRQVAGFLQRLWQSGALQGRSADEAFFVKCDRSTMTQDDIDRGRLVCLIGVAPLKPAEFVVVRIGQWTADRND
ncbi:MAG: phage tail sheath subtilisin-like domain-containing protein [Pyrinomonadaceae bacterium]